MNQNKQEYERKSTKNIQYQDVMQESKFLYDLSNGASNRRRLFQEIDVYPLCKKVDQQDDIIWSEKNMSLSMSKIPQSFQQKYNNPFDFDNFQIDQNMEQHDNGLKEITDKSISTLQNVNNMSYQAFCQFQKSQFDPKHIKKGSKQFTSQSKTLIGINPERKQGDYLQGTPQKPNDAKTKTIQKRFNIMLQIKKFQNKILKKSPRYIFRNSIAQQIPYKFLNDKTFSLEDYKLQQNMKRHQIYSLGKFLFDTLSFIVILANIIYLPIFHSFNHTYDVFDYGIIEYLTICFLAFEIFVNLSTQYYHRGLLIKDRVKVIKRYLKGRICSCQFENQILYTNLTENILFHTSIIFLIEKAKQNLFIEKREYQELLKLLFRLDLKQQFKRRKIFCKLKLLLDMLVCIPYLFSVINPRLRSMNLLYLLRFMDFLNISNKIEDKLIKNNHIGDALKCFLLIFFVAHLSSCTIHYISVLPKQFEDKSYLDTVEVNKDQWFEVYAYTFYWSIITMTTIGYGDIHPNSHRERIFATFFALLSCVVFGFTLNLIGQIISNIYMSSAQIRRKQAIVDQYMKQRNVSPDLQIQVKKNIEYIHKNSGQQDKLVDEIINSLTSSLKNKLKVELYQKLLKGVQSFHFNFSDQFLSELSMLFKEQTFTQEHYIYSEKEMPDKLYYIIKGEIELYCQTSKCPVFVKKGDLLGLEEFFSQQCRPMTAKTSRVTTVAYINYNDFIDVLKKFQLDQETYRMIFDSLNLNGYSSRIQIKCYNCNSLTHKFIECPYLFFQKDEKVFRENKLIQKGFLKHFEIQEERQLFERQNKKFQVYKKMTFIWEQTLQYLFDNIDILEDYYYNQVEKNFDEDSDSSENEGEEEDDDENLDDHDEDSGQEKYKSHLSGDSENQNQIFYYIRLFKSQRSEKDPEIKQGQQKIDTKSQFAQYLLAGKNRSGSNLQIDIQQMIAQNQVETNTSPVLTADSHLTPKQKLEESQDNKQQMKYFELSNENQNRLESQKKQSQLNKNNIQNNHHSFSFFGQKDEEVFIKNKSKDDLQIQRKSKDGQNISLNRNSQNQSFHSETQTHTNVNSPLSNNYSQSIRHKDILKSDEENDNNSRQEGSNYQSFQEHASRKASYFSGYQIRKVSDVNKDDLQNTVHLMPISNQQQKEDIEGTMTPIGRHQFPQTQNEYVMMNNGERHQMSISNFDENNKSNLNNNIIVEQSVQQNNSSYFHLEPLSPSKNNINKAGSGSVIPSLNKENMFSHSEFQFDTQSDNSPLKKQIVNNLNGHKILQNFQNQIEFEVNSNKKISKISSQISNNSSRQNAQDDRINQQVVNAKGQLISGVASCNSVSIKLDDYQEQNHNSFASHSLIEVRNRENSSKFQQMHRNGSNKNNTLNLGGFQAGSVFESDIDNQINQEGAIGSANIQTNPQTQSLNPHSNIVHTSHQNNSSSANAGTKNSVRKTDENPSSNLISGKSEINNEQNFQGRGVSNKKKTYAGIFDEQLQSIKNDSDKEKVISYFQRSQKNIRSQKLIDNGTQNNRRGNRKQTKQKKTDIMTTSIQDGLDQPRLFKHQSTRKKQTNIQSIDRMELSHQYYSKNRQEHDYQDLYSQNINVSSPLKHSQSHKFRASLKGFSEQHQKALLDSITINSRIMDHSRKYSQKQVSCKLPDSSVRTPTYLTFRDQPKSQTKYLQSINSLNESETLVPQFDYRDDDDESDDSVDNFNRLPDFDIMKSFKVYCPWNNYTRVIKNIYYPKKKKYKDLVSLLTNSKLLPKPFRLQDKINEKTKQSSPPLNSFNFYK